MPKEKNVHKSVGIIIRRDDKILLIDRKNPPFGWACPAGHVEEGETVEEALIKETKEEVGLDLKKFKLITHKYISWNKCVMGERGHDWHVYEALEWVGEPKMEQEEAKDMKWVKIDKIKSLKLEKIWQLWFKQLKVI